MVKILACVAEKHTKKPMSETYELSFRCNCGLIHVLHHFVRLLEEKVGIEINGKTNYMDYVLIEGTMYS